MEEIKNTVENAMISSYENGITYGKNDIILKIITACNLNPEWSKDQLINYILTQLK